MGIVIVSRDKITTVVILSRDRITTVVILSRSYSITLHRESSVTDGKETGAADNQ